MIRRIIFQYWLIVILGLVSVVNLDAQSRGEKPSPAFVPDSLKGKTISNLPDTIKLGYFKLSDITKQYDFQDSTLDHFFHHYDPAKRRDIDYINLGNAGSAARAMEFQSAPYIGFNSGLNQYDLYNLKLDDFRFFENNIPFTDVGFTPVGGQQNFVVKSDFARKFSDGTSLSLNYRRIRQEGFYRNQLTKTTNFGASVRIKGFSNRYTGFVSMLSNVNEEGHNGGVLTDTLFSEALYSDRLNYPTVVDDAQTRHQQKLYSLINYYQLNKSSKSDIQLLLRYDLSFDFRYYKFADADVDTKQDSTYYGQFLIEDRGIRFYDRINTVRNAFYAYMSDGKRLNVRAGIVYDRYDIDQNGIASGFDNAYLDFKGDVPFSKSLSIATTAQLGLLDGSGDFNIKGSLRLNAAKWIDLDGGVAFFRYTPSLMSRSVVLNGLPFWSNEYTKPFGSELFGSFSIPKLKIKGRLKQTLLTNAIYFDSLSSPIQLDEVFSATSLSLSNEFRIGKFGMENYAMFQLFNNNVYHLPSFFSKHNIHTQGYLFNRALFARLGAEVRITPAYVGAEYSPVIGNFFQSSKTLEFYPMTDVYFTGKIQSFRFFLRFENVVNLFGDKVQYQVANYPQFDFKFRFGLSWLLLN